MFKGVDKDFLHTQWYLYVVLNNTIRAVANIYMNWMKMIKELLTINLCYQYFICSRIHIDAIFDNV